MRACYNIILHSGDTDMSEEAMMLQAIAMSLGEEQTTESTVSGDGQEATRGEVITSAAADGDGETAGPSNSERQTSETHTSEGQTTSVADVVTEEHKVEESMQRFRFVFFNYT